MHFDTNGELSIDGHTIEIGDAYQGFALRAVIQREGPVAIFESEGGEFLFACPDDQMARLEPRMRSANPAPEGPKNGATDPQQIIDDCHDTIGEKIIAHGDITHENIASMLPRVVGYGFVADVSSGAYAIVRPDGSIEDGPGPLVDLSAPHIPKTTQWGLLDVSVPLPVLRVKTNNGETAGQVVVPETDGPGSFRALVRRRRLSPGRERIQYLSNEESTEISAPEFYGALYDFWRQTDEFMGALATVKGGDTEFNGLAQSSLWLADLTMRANLPRYGVGPYDQARHHSFPPAMLCITLCLLEWGHSQRAEKLLGSYIEKYITEHGRFDYYGPAVAEYGQLLDLVARFIQLTGNFQWFQQRRDKLQPVWQRLLNLRKASLENGTSPKRASGLIRGLPEADYHNQDEQWEEYYFSGNAWVIRGLTEIAQILDGCGDNPAARALRNEADRYRQDLQAAVDHSKVQHDDGVFVPAGPTQLQPILNMTDNRHASYCNYRYFAEMVSAGILDTDTMRQIFQWRRNHGGELLGMTRFQDWLDDWPVMHYGRALLELGDIDHYRLLMHAHLVHHQAVGWLTAYEQVDVMPERSGVRAAHAGQVVPCQVTVPLMLRWALAYELRDDDILLIAPAVPHHWITADQPLQVQGLPTRWGPIGFRMHASNGVTHVQAELPQDFEAALRVRLPVPAGRSIYDVHIDGAGQSQYGPQMQLVTIHDAAQTVQITAMY